jgi:hypothetical protein
LKQILGLKSHTMKNKLLIRAEDIHGSKPFFFALLEVVWSDVHASDPAALRWPYAFKHKGISAFVLEIQANNTTLFTNC